MLIHTLSYSAFFLLRAYKLPSLNLRKIFTLSSIYGITPILDKAVAMLLLPVLTHYLDRNQYGSLVLLYASAYLIQLFIFMGFPDTLAKVYWDYSEKKRQECLGTAWTTTLLLNIALAIPLVFFSRRIAESVFSNRAVSILIVLVLVKISLSAQSIIPMVAFRAREKKYHVLAVNLISTFCRLGLTLLFLIRFRMDLPGVFLAEIITNLIVLFIYIPCLAREIRPRFSLHYLKHILSIAPYQFVVAVLAWVIHLSDRLFIQHITHDIGEVGVYAVGYTFGSAILFLIQPLHTAWRPHVYALNSQSPEEYTAQMGSFFAFFTVWCSASFLLIAALAPDFIRILTPAPYHRAVSIVPVVLSAQILASLSNYFLPNFFIHKKVNVTAWIYMTAAIINAGINIYLIELIGIMGAAISSLASYGIMFALILAYSQRLVRLKINSFAFLFLFFCIILGYCISMLTFQNILISLTVKTSLLAFIFGFIYKAFGAVRNLKKNV